MKLNYDRAMSALSRKPMSPWCFSILGLLLMIILVSPGLVTGDSFYVANDGDDGNIGTAPDDAWQTLSRVSASTFQPGDSILLKRGDEWYESLMIPSSGTLAGPIVFGSYGTGALPRILGSIKLTEWSHVVGNIWVGDAETTDPSRGAPHDGSQSGSGGYPGGAWFEELDGTVTWGHQEKYINSPGDFAELTREYDWGWFDDHIYVYSAVDPGPAYVGMQVSQRQYAVGMADNDPKEHIVIDGLELLYTQSKGFYAGYPAREAHDLTIRNCHVGYVGIKGAASAYGLAVWYSDMLIRNNEIHDCGRRSVSYNVYATRNVTFANVVIEDNSFHHGYHTTGIDIANSGTDAMVNFVVRNNYFAGDPTEDLGAEGAFNSNHIWTQTNPGGSLTDFFFYNNIFTYCHGKGLTINGITNAHVYFNTFYGVNPTLANYQAQLYFSGTVTNAVVRNNIFYNDADPSFNGYFFCVKADSDHLAEVDSDFNLYFTSDPGAAIVDIVGITGSYSMAEWEAYKSETGWDATSPSPADPIFVDAPGGDLHLGAGSPAIDAGEVVPGINVDHAGNPRSVPPSLGAYAYGYGDELFSDDFESGNANGWTTVVP